MMITHYDSAMRFFSENAKRYIENEDLTSFQIKHIQSRKIIAVNNKKVCNYYVILLNTIRNNLFYKENANATAYTRYRWPSRKT